jgi:peptide/nickel transport system permease protein
MVRYVIRRLGYMVVTMVFVIILGFVIIELPPGSYLEFEIERIRALGGELGVEQIRALEIKYGVNDPVYIKFWKRVSGFVRGDFGLS